MSKSCKDFKEIINEYVDRELPEIELNEYKEHLDSCKSCSKELQELKKALAMLKSYEKVKAPADFSTQLKKRISVEVNVSRSYKMFIIKVVSMLLISTLSFAVVYKVVENSVNIAKVKQLKAKSVAIIPKDSVKTIIEDSVEVDSMAEDMKQVEKAVIKSFKTEKQAPNIKENKSESVIDTIEQPNDTLESPVLNLQGRSLLNEKLGIKSETKNSKSPIEVSIALYPWKSGSGQDIFSNSYSVIEENLQAFHGKIVVAPDSIKSNSPYRIEVQLPVKDFEKFIQKCGSLGNIDGTDDFVKLTDVGFVRISMYVYYIANK